MTALLAMRGVTLVRGERQLFDAFDLSVAPEEAVLLTGPNGVGKSSLLRLAAGLLVARQGTISSAAAALVDEHPALDEERALGDALRFWAMLDGGGGDLAKVLDRMGIARLADIPVRYLSSGQRKRAALARALACGAPLWLLDEPANALDADGVARLAAAIADHRAAGGAVVAASHVPLGGQWTTRDLAPCAR